MKLYHQIIGTGPPLVILHGLLGSHENWRAIAKALGENYTVNIPDLRNHGLSPHDESMTYPLLAADVAELLDDSDIVKPAVLGHSMGGKIAMQLAMVKVNEKMASRQKQGEQRTVY